MKLLSSDYDGTINVHEYDIWFNLASIQYFMSLGNIFTLNTGRPYESIKKEIDKYDIPYHYLACNDGNLLMNKNGEVLYVTDMHTNINYVLEKLREKFPSIELTPHMFEGRVLEYEIITEEINDELIKELDIICDRCNLAYKIFNIGDKRNVYVGYRKISKSSAIEHVKELEKIAKCDIFTIGDDLNDFEMVRDFKGYTFPWGVDKLKSVSCGLTSSVGSLIKKITK